MASILIQISLEVNIDISMVMCIFILSLLSYILARAFIVEGCDGSGEEIKLRSVASKEESEFHSAEDETRLTPNDLCSLEVEYWASFGEDEIANLENYLEIE